MTDRNVESPDRVVGGPGGASWLVTGATGVIGPAVVDAIVGSGASVRVLTRAAAPPLGGWPWKSSAVDVEVVVGDVRDGAAVRSAMRGVQFVVHAAGLAHRRPDSEPAARRLVDENVDGARTVSQAARAERVTRVVFLSSAAVYGPAGRRPRDESTSPQPVTAYGRSKLEAELAMRELLDDALTVLRVCAVYGPRLRGQHAVLARAIASPWPVPVVQGHGHCLITDGDLATAIVGVACQPAAAGSVLNVSDGSTYSVGEIVGAMRTALGTPRWRTPILPGWLGVGAARALGLLGGPEWSRRGRLHQGVQSLIRGAALDSTALRRVLPDWQCESAGRGWTRAVATPLGDDEGSAVRSGDQTT